MEKMYLVSCDYRIKRGDVAVDSDSAIFTVPVKVVHSKRLDNIEFELRSMVKGYCIQRYRYSPGDVNVEFADGLLNHEFELEITVFRYSKIGEYDPLVPLKDLTEGDDNRALLGFGQIRYNNKVANIARMFTDAPSRYSGTVSTLNCLVEQGTLFDGDVPCKTGRDELIQMGLATKVVVMAQDGENAATHLGRDVYTYMHGKSGSIKEAMAHRIASREINSISKK